MKLVYAVASALTAELSPVSSSVISSITFAIDITSSVSSSLTIFTPCEVRLCMDIFSTFCRQIVPFCVATITSLWRATTSASVTLSPAIVFLNFRALTPTPPLFWTLNSSTRIFFPNPLSVINNRNTFIQGHLSTQADIEMLNIGLVQRHSLYENKLMMGFNFFYDLLIGIRSHSKRRGKVRRIINMFPNFKIKKFLLKIVNKTFIGSH